MRALAVWDLSAVVETERMICGLQVGQVRAEVQLRHRRWRHCRWPAWPFTETQDRREGHRPLTPTAPVSPRYAYRRVTGFFV